MTTMLRRPKTLLSAFVFAAFAALSGQAMARTSHHHRAAAHHHTHGTRIAFAHHRGGSHVLQCVAFAKTASEVKLHGNARDWWYNAAGRYERGHAPSSGSVLNFRGIRRMPLGHVAVVREIANSRTIFIDQSHWAANGIARHVRVVDVSPRNDWSAVRVALNGNKDRLGSIYPTYGFIYPHQAPDQVPALARETHLPHSTEVASAPSDSIDADAPNRSIR